MLGINWIVKKMGLKSFTFVSFLNVFLESFLFCFLLLLLFLTGMTWIYIIFYSLSFTRCGSTHVLRSSLTLILHLKTYQDQQEWK